MPTTDDSSIDYWSLIEPVWLPLNESWSDDPGEFLRAFRLVRPEIGHLYAVHWCQSEICNGGLRQFFSNTTGLLAPEALNGFRAMELGEWAAILAEAMQIFGPAYPRDRADREELLAKRELDKGDMQTALAVLDDRCFAWLHAEPDRWECAANRYAARVAK